MEDKVENRQSIETEASPKLCVLQVEDDPILRRLIGMNLEDLGVAYESAATGMEAIKKFEGQKKGFNVLMTDFDMPGLNGAELIIALKSVNPELISIILSGRAKDDDEINKLMGNVTNDYYLTKPFTYESLQIVLEEIKITLNKKAEKSTSL